MLSLCIMQMTWLLKVTAFADFFALHFAALSTLVSTSLTTKNALALFHRCRVHHHNRAGRQQTPRHPISRLVDSFGTVQSWCVANSRSLRVILVLTNAKVGNTVRISSNARTPIGKGRLRLTVWIACRLPCIQSRQPDPIGQHKLVHDQRLPA